MFKNMLNLNLIGTLLKIFSKMTRKNECQEWLMEFDLIYLYDHVWLQLSSNRSNRMDQFYRVFSPPLPL